MSDWLFELTPAELRELRDQIHELMERRVGRPRREESERVHAVLQLFPRRREGS